jgi:hypothetical protein
MPKKHSGKWRTLDDTEIALVKGMKEAELARDYIVSFFVRPGRVISPAVVSELVQKRPEILAATREDVETFINRRLNEASAEPSHHGFGPTSSIRVREILQLTRDGQTALPGFESLFAEFKRELPSTKEAKAKIAKCLAAFANHEGGYVFLGVENDGAVVGISTEGIERLWDQLSDVITRHFTPFFRWERAVVEVGSHAVAVAYAYKSGSKPIMASSDFTNEICAGQIYFRYNRSNEAIRPADLLHLLHERDRMIVASMMPTDPFTA